MPPSVAEPGGGPEGISDGGRNGLGPASGLAMVVKLDDVLWVPREGPHPSEGGTRGGGRLQFRSGRITLSMLTGVMLVVEGPADLELVAARSRSLVARGGSELRVPKGAEGFVVASPASAVIDLGTEFALNVESDGKSRVMVFEGLAEARRSWTRRGSPETDPACGQAREFELDPGHDRIAESVARPEGFVSTAELAPRSLVLSPDYAATVMRSRPRGVLAVSNRSPTAWFPTRSPAARRCGPTGRSGSESQQGNDCAVFAPGSPEQYLGTDEPCGNRRRIRGPRSSSGSSPTSSAMPSLVGLLPPSRSLFYQVKLHAMCIPSSSSSRPGNGSP